MRYDGSGDSHALLLAAGQLGGVTVGILLNPHSFQGIHHATFGFFLGHLLHVQHKGHVLENRHVRPKSIRLEHQIHAALSGILKVKFLGVYYQMTVHFDGAALGLLQAGDHAQGGGLAAAAGPQQGHEFSVIHRQVQIFQNMVGTVKFINILQNDLAHTLLSFSTAQKPWLMSALKNLLAIQ